VNGSAVFQVAAQTDSQVFKSALFLVKSEHIKQCLGGVKMASVACVDDRAVGSKGRSLCSALGGVAHNHDISVGGYYFCGILQVLALCNGRGCRVIEADDSTAETEHCSLERHLSTGRRLIEQGSHDLALASLGIFCGIIADIGAELYNVQPPVAAHVI